MKFDASKFLPPYASSTNVGIAAVGGAFTGYLTGQMDKGAAISVAIGGLISILLPQHTGTTVVNGANPLIQAASAVIQTVEGSTTLTETTRGH